MQSTHTPTGTECRVSGLAPSQPHPKSLLLSVQSHETTIFPSALVGELGFKKLSDGEAPFRSSSKLCYAWSAEVPIQPLYFSRGQDKGQEGLRFAEANVKSTQRAITQTLRYTTDSHETYPWPSRNVTLHKTRGFEKPKAKLI